MKVFYSWSGGRSRATAELLSEWIKCVIQATEPWISTRDIDRGATWFSAISDVLKDTTIGIVCITQENKHNPWILFESGALAKGLSSNRVCTFLIDLEPSEIEDPLAQFNHTLPDRDGIWQLIKTINSCLESGRLEERILEKVFSTYWGEFDEKFKQIIKSQPASSKTETRSEKDLLGEILENTRFLLHGIRNLEPIPVTEQQRAVLELVALGESNSAIAKNLGITERTLKIYIADLYQLLGVDSRLALAKEFARMFPI